MTPGERVKRIHLARDASISALVCIEQDQYAEAFLLAAIVMVHLSHVAADHELQRVIAEVGS